MGLQTTIDAKCHADPWAVGQVSLMVAGGWGGDSHIAENSGGNHCSVSVGSGLETFAETFQVD